MTENSHPSCIDSRARRAPAWAGAPSVTQRSRRKHRSAPAGGRQAHAALAHGKKEGAGRHDDDLTTERPNREDNQKMKRTLTAGLAALLMASTASRRAASRSA